MILAQAGRFGGWSLYLKDGKPMYAYNFLGLKTYKVAATEALPAGKATIRYEFAYDGGGLGKGGTGTILVNGKKVAEGRIDRTQGYHLLGGRRRGRRPGWRDARDGRLQGGRQQVHRQDRQGDHRSEVMPRLAGGACTRLPAAGIESDGVSVKNEMPMKKLLGLAAALEGTTGVALMIDPPSVARLLLGGDPTGAGRHWAAWPVSGCCRWDWPAGLVPVRPRRAPFPQGAADL